MENVAVPPVFETEMVYVCKGAKAVAVPVMSPVLEFSTKPVGSAGTTVQRAGPPPLVGWFVNPSPSVTVGAVYWYVVKVGVTSVNPRNSVYVSEPPAFVAVTLYEAMAVSIGCVPEMVPVDWSKERPEGNVVGDIDHCVECP
jgi:hypothetical protein